MNFTNFTTFGFTWVELKWVDSKRVASADFRPAEATRAGSLLIEAFLCGAMHSTGNTDTITRSSSERIEDASPSELLDCCR